MCRSLYRYHSHSLLSLLRIFFLVAGKYCGRPLPSYLESGEEGEEEEEGLVGGPLDIKYHLLRLYADRSHSLESLLSPASHTADQLDTRLAWLVHQVPGVLHTVPCTVGWSVEFFFDWTEQVN